MDGYVAALTIITGFLAILAIYCAYCEEREKSKRKRLQTECDYHRKRAYELEKRLADIKKENTLYRGLFERKEV